MRRPHSCFLGIKYSTELKAKSQLNPPAEAKPAASFPFKKTQISEESPISMLLRRMEPPAHVDGGMASQEGSREADILAKDGSDLEQLATNNDSQTKARGLAHLSTLHQKRLHPTIEHFFQLEYMAAPLQGCLE